MHTQEDYFEIHETEILIDDLEMVSHFLEASTPCISR
jgi:hypothetical protein